MSTLSPAECYAIEANLIYNPMQHPSIPVAWPRPPPYWNTFDANSTVQYTGSDRYKTQIKDKNQN